MKISIALIACVSAQKDWFTKEWQVTAADQAGDDIVLSDPSIRSGKQWHECGEKPALPENGKSVECNGAYCAAVCPKGEYLYFQKYPKIISLSQPDKENNFSFKVIDPKLIGDWNVVPTINGTDQNFPNVSHVTESVLVILVKVLICKKSTERIFQFWNSTVLIVPRRWISWVIHIQKVERSVKQNAFVNMAKMVIHNGKNHAHG